MNVYTLCASLFLTLCAIGAFTTAMVTKPEQKGQWTIRGLFMLTMTTLLILLGLIPPTLSR